MLYFIENKYHEPLYFDDKAIAFRKREEAERFNQTLYLNEKGYVISEEETNWDFGDAKFIYCDTLEYLNDCLVDYRTGETVYI